jgi:aryl-alcohol dehydrogenase-like predicted oxidoreductase
MHWFDKQTPLEETLAALSELVAEGKVRYIGASHFTGWQVADCDWIARSSSFERFISAQNHYNLLERDIEVELVPACERFGVGILPYFPLASGMLTGKYQRDRPPPEGARLSNRPVAVNFYDQIDALTAFAQARGRTLLEVAIAGLAVRPAVSSVIAGATRPQQVSANAAAIEWVPTAEDVVELNRILTPAA